MYDPDLPAIIDTFDKEGNKTGISVRKKTWHYYTAGHQMQALTLLANYYYGRPQETIKVDKNVNVKIEQRVADFTKLLNDNYERLRLIKGGKDDKKGE